MIECPLQVGKPVARIAFTDAAGKHWPRAEALMIESVTLEECTSIPSYWRVKARSDAETWEGAARLFEAAP